MNWIRNSWYQAGWSEEVLPGQPLCRTILNEPIVFYRTGNGSLAALFDRCPHRFAPLSAGRFEGDTVTCGYHGLVFGADGVCVHNPHGAISARLSVRSYCVAERHEAIWVWMGEPERADPDFIPALSFIDEAAELATIRGYMPTDCDYRLLSDNIMDLSHADYMHPTSLGGMMTKAQASCVVDGNRVTAEWLAHDYVPPAAFKPLVPAGANADIRVEAVWLPPAVMVVNIAAREAGADRPLEADASTLHNMTPETEDTTHYFFCATRRFGCDDAELTAYLREALTHAFMNEDKPMLEKQQARIGRAEFWSLKPVLLSIDTASVLARRRLDALIAAEKAAAACIVSGTGLETAGQGG